MNKNQIIVTVIVILLVILAIGWFAYSRNAVVIDDGSMMESEGEVIDDEGAMMDGAGSYEAYAPEKLAMAENGDVVLFFRASWCPTCRVLDADIRSHLDDIPENVTILHVDYDNSTELKQRYGVTYQHTLVQVDAEGNQIAKWTGSPTLSALLQQVI